MFSFAAPIAAALLTSCALRVGDSPDRSGGSGATSSSNASGGSDSSAGAGGSSAGHTVGHTVGPSSGSGASTGSAGGESASTAGTATSASSASSSSAASGSSSASSGGGGCYWDGDTPAVPIGDLQASYVGSGWLATMIEILHRRFQHGYFVLDSMKTDPWLKSDFPKYFSLGSWDGMIDAIDTACHEETHGYDFDQALGSSGNHVFFHGEDIVAPKLDFFPRSEILAEVQAGGSVTSSYDSTYLTGSQGSYGFIFLADELTAYINGLACVTVVSDHVTQGASYRDGAAAHLLYLELYLRVARTKHPALYAAWKAEPSWQHFVRLAWARGHYWYARALPFPLLGLKDAPIWGRVQEPTNRAEIELFTGDDPDTIACSP